MKYRETQSHYYDGSWRTVTDKEIGSTEADAVAELERLSKLRADLWEALQFLRTLSGRDVDMAKAVPLVVNYTVMHLFHPGITGSGSDSAYEAQLSAMGVSVSDIWSEVVSDA